MSNRLFTSLVILLAAAITLAIWQLTRSSEGFAIDSMFYLSQARSLAASGTLLTVTGAGAPVFTTHWPPLYPALLALFGKFTGDPLPGARVLNAVVLAANIPLMALLGRRATQSGAGGLTCAFIFACAPTVLFIHTNVMSEAPCQLFWLLSLWLLLGFCDNKTWSWLVGAGLAAGLALATRYAAISAIPAGVFFLLAFSRESWRKRIGEAAVFAAMAMLPLGIYSACHRLATPALADPSLTSAITDRHFAYYGLAFPQLLSTLRALGEWVCPIDTVSFKIRAIFFVLFGAGLVGAIFLLAKHRRAAAAFAAANRDLASLLGLNLFAYLAVLLLTGLFLDPGLDLSARMFVPAFACAILLLGAAWPALRATLALQPRGWAGGAASGLFIIFIILYSLGTVLWLRQPDDAYLGLASAYWRDSSAVALIKKLPAAAPLYSNQIKLPYLYTGRTDLTTLPMREPDNQHHTLNENFSRDMAALVAALAKNHGVVVALTADLPSLHRYASIAELKANPALQVSAETPDAVFFVAAHPAAPLGN